MSDELTIEDRLVIVTDLLDSFEGPIKNISTLKWNPSEGFWTLILRSVLVRQLEALRAMIDLVKSERAHLCVPLLRPAVEEYLWMKFLLTLTDEDREEFIFGKVTVEGFETLKAQWDDAGTEVMIWLGFPTDFLIAMGKASERGSKSLKEMAARLGWTVRNKPIPSTRFVAKQTGNEDMYALIYHATSRTVHFTAAELLRRTWVESEGVTVSSKMMGGYWAGFTLYWGPRLFLLTFLELMGDFERLNIDVELDDGMDAVVKRFLAFGKVPIVTPEELNLRNQQKW